MVETIPQELASVIEDLRRQVAMLSARVTELQPAAPVPPAAATEPVAAAREVETHSGITQEELLAISGALAAYLGVRVHIRQVRLISTHAWAQQGRATIQASHRLHS
jgi:methylmalonyl-CoA carboxyltransferase 12S subunit